MIPSRLEFTRITSGEYRAILRGAGSYTLDHIDGGWTVGYHPTYNVHIRIGHYRRLPEAQVAANAHALRAGLVAR